MNSGNYVSDQEVSQLIEIELFKNLTFEQVRRVLAHAEKIHFRKNEIIRVY